MSNSTALTPIQRVAQVLESDGMKSKLAASLDGMGISPERFARQALAALNANPYVVQRCTVPSVVSAVMTAASLRLELNPSLGQAYVVPRGQDATLQIGYRGWLQLAWNSGRLTALDVGVIHEKDQIDYVRGTAPRLDIRPPLGDRGPVVAYYCAAQWVGGGISIEVMSRDEVISHRDRFSDSWKRQGAKGPWGTDFDEMAKKTVVLKARKSWPVSLVPAGVDLDADGNARQVSAHHEPERDVRQDASTGTVYDAATGEIIEPEAAPEQAAAQENRRRPSRLATFTATAKSA
jgi:recombination protein RecT